MPIVVEGWERQRGAGGQCVRMLQALDGVPHTSRWRPGARVQNMHDLAPGTVIATFHGERYANQTDGSSHAAVFIRHEEQGAIRVFDTWQNRAGGAQERTIREKHGAGPASDDAGKYHVVEVV